VAYEELTVGAKLSPGHPFFELIEEGYKTFLAPKPSSIGVCEHCCMDPRKEADFFNPPVRNLPVDYVRDWYFGAYEPRGVPKDTWTYLLPRILEILAAEEEVASVGIEVSLNRFQTGDSDNWSTKQWSVLDRFQRRFLRHKIEVGDDRLDDILCMFNLAGWPVDGLISQVASCPDVILAERLWRDWCADGQWEIGSIWMTAFWESPNNTAAFDFYTSPELHARMEALALADETEPSLVAKASAIVSTIEASGNWG